MVAVSISKKGVVKQDSVNADRITRQSKGRHVAIAGEWWLGRHSRGGKINLTSGDLCLRDKVIGARSWNESYNAQILPVGQVNLDSVKGGHVCEANSDRY